MPHPDPRAQRQIAAQLQRVLIVDPSTPSARLLADLLKDLGARYIHLDAVTTRAALEACQAIQPQMVFTEYHGANLDGLAFVRAVRRSTLACRMTPITVVTSEATAASITASRDSGVHEFLRKPFTMKDLMRRVEAVTLKSRPWVEAVEYIGPDRRRFNSGDYQGARKRKSDSGPATTADRMLQALKILRAAINAIESDPTQALRSMLVQASELQVISVELNDTKLAQNVFALRQALKLATASGALSRPELETAAAGLWQFNTETNPAKTAA